MRTDEITFYNGLLDILVEMVMGTESVSMEELDEFPRQGTYMGEEVDLVYKVSGLYWGDVDSGYSYSDVDGGEETEVLEVPCLE